MTNKVGTHLSTLASSSGGITDELGNNIINTDTSGGDAQTLGTGLRRELIAGIANGDFGFTPNQATGVLGDGDDKDENLLPFWDIFQPAVDANKVNIRLVPTSSAASGYELRFRVKAGAPYGTAGAAENTWYLYRYLPVAASRARSFIYQPRTTWFCTAGTSSANISIWASAQYYTREQAAIGSAASGSAVSTGINQEVGINPGSGFAVDGDAGYILYKTGITVTGAITNTEDCIIREIRMDQGTVQTLLADQSAPATYRASTLLNNGRRTTAIVGGAGASAYLDATATSSPSSRGIFSFDTVTPIGATYSNGTVAVPQSTVTKLNLGASPDAGAVLGNPASNEVTPPAGLYLVIANGFFEAESGGKYRRIRIFKNAGEIAGVTLPNMSAAAPDDEMCISSVISVNGTDTLSVRADHDHNGNIDVTCTEFSLIRLGAAW